MLRAGLALTVGGLRSTSAAPAGGPLEIVVDRDLDVPVDAARLRLTDAGPVGAGDPVTVGLGEAGAVQTVFAGTVAEVGAGIGAVAGRCTEVVALGRLRALVDLRVAALYEDRTLGAVARDLLTRAGLAPGQVNEGPTLPRVAVDVRRSAYEHLRALAHRFGLEVWADRDGRVHVRAPGGASPDGLGGAGGLGGLAGAVAAGGPRFGADVLAGRAARRRAAWDVVDVAGESPSSTRGRSAAAWLTTDDQAARASAGSGDRTALVLDPLARTRELAQEAATGRLAGTRRRGEEAIVSVVGRPDLDLGDELALGDTPDPLPGVRGHVRALRHRLDARSGLTTTVRLATAARR